MKKSFLIFAAVTVFFSVSKAQINVQCDGKVMIGSSTATPIAPLHVLGDTYIPLGSSYGIGATTDAGPRLRMHNNGSDSYIDYCSKLYLRSGCNNGPFEVLIGSSVEIK